MSMSNQEKSRRFWVGRNDGKPLPGTKHRKRSFPNSAQAENEIRRIQRLDPTGLVRGEYYFDSPDDCD